MKRGLAGLLFLSVMLGTGAAYAKEKPLSIETGRKVSFDYVLTVDGKEADSSKGRGPLSFVKGSGQIIPGLDKQLTGMKAGESKTVTVTPAEAYGNIDPKALKDVPRTALPKGVDPKVGMMLQMLGNNGQSIPVKIVEVKKESVVIDLNHPFAGKTLVFKIKIVSVQ